MKDKFFLDSNIFLYAFSTSNLQKQEVAKKLVLADAVISVQVINEVSVNLIKKLKFDEDTIKKFVDSTYSRYQVLDISKDMFINASDLREEHNLSYFDSIIVSAALISDCTVLYSEDMHHNLVITVNFAKLKNAIIHKK
jgi:predicted nucleic acid-binding protein